MATDMANNDKWYFTTQLNRDGLMYLYAYQTSWNPEKKRSERARKKYAGRVLPDGSIAFSKTFLEAFPQYVEDKFIFDAATKRPQVAGAQSGGAADPASRADAAEDPNSTTRSIGLSWAIFETARSMGVIEDLQTVFGKEDGYALFLLVVYKLHGGVSMAGFKIWQEDVYLERYLGLPGQRISELLTKVSNTLFSNYFSLRHARKVREYGEHKLLPYACDSTNISTYSQTIDEAAYGHAKRDPELKIVNYAWISDQLSGDIVFAYEYEGSINDVSSLKSILAHMVDMGMDLSNIVLLTDRGYASIFNICKMLQTDLKFVQGVRICEDSVKQLFRKHKDSLSDISFYNHEIESCSYAETELVDGQRLNLHLYRMPASSDLVAKRLMDMACATLDKLKEGQSVPPDEWDRSGRYLVKKKGEHRKEVWAVNTDKIKAAVEFEGVTALRTNVTSDPILAMKMYRTRTQIELNFNQFKNWVGGDRFRCTATSQLGSLLVTTIATSLRMVMLYRVNQSVEKGMKKPDDSLNSIFETLKKLKVDKQLSGNAWVRRDIPKKYREMFDLVQVAHPPRFLK